MSIAGSHRSHNPSVNVGSKDEHSEVNQEDFSDNDLRSEFYDESNVSSINNGDQNANDISDDEIKHNLKILNKKKEILKMDDLTKVFQHEKFSLTEEKKISFFKMACYFLLSVVFLTSFLLTIEINKANDIYLSLKEIFQFTRIRNTQRKFPDIHSKNELNNFIHDTYLSQFYNENVKEFPNKVNNNHFVKGVNYFVGMRLTHKRAILKNTTIKSSDSIPFRIRLKNYNGYTDSSFSDIDKSQFGPNNTTYSENGGFAGKGGFVHYFQPNLTYENANKFYTSLVNSGLLDEKLICITFEMLFHNENYQTGVLLIHEYMINNAGELKVYEDSKFYHNSRYSVDPNQFTRNGFYYSPYFLVFL